MVVRLFSMYQPPGPWNPWLNNLTYGRSSPADGGRNRMIAEPFPALSTSGFQKRSSCARFVFYTLFVSETILSYIDLLDFFNSENVVICITSYFSVCCIVHVIHYVTSIWYHVIDRIVNSLRLTNSLYFFLSIEKKPTDFSIFFITSSATGSFSFKCQ